METEKSSDHKRCMTSGVTAMASTSRESTNRHNKFNASAININLKVAMQALNNK